MAADELTTYIMNGGSIDGWVDQAGQNDENIDHARRKYEARRDALVSQGALNPDYTINTDTGGTGTTEQEAAKQSFKTVTDELSGYKGLIEGALGEGGSLGTEFGAYDTSTDISQLRDVTDQYRRIASGENDSQFNAFRDAQINLLESQKQQQLGSTSEFFQRRGVTGSAELNQLRGVENQYGGQQQALTSQIGLQKLQRQDQGRAGVLSSISQSSALGLQGQQQQNAASQSEFEAEIARLETAGIPSSLLLKLLAIQQTGGEEGKQVPIDI